MVLWGLYIVYYGGKKAWLWSRSVNENAYSGVSPDVHLEPVIFAEAFFAVGALVGTLTYKREGRKKWIREPVLRMLKDN